MTEAEKKQLEALHRAQRAVGAQVLAQGIKIGDEITIRGEGAGAMFDVRADFIPDSFNAEDRTVEAIFTTDKPCKRYSWDGPFYEILDMKPASVKLERMRKGAPVLDTHSRWSLEDVLGVVDSVKVEGSQLVGKVRFSKREAVEPYFQDVKDGILRNVSVGYTIHKMVKEAEVDGIPTYRVTSWEPSELSFVPVPADIDAVVRCTTTPSAPPANTPVNQEKTMTPEEIAAAEAARKQKEEAARAQAEAAATAAANAAATAAANAAATAAANAATAAERKRGSDIRAAVVAAGLPETVAAELIDAGDSIDQARAKVIEKMAAARAAGAGSVVPHVQGGADQRDAFRAGVAEALVYRADPRKSLSENARQYAHMSLLEYARLCLNQSGVRTQGMSKSQIAERAFMGTSDFPIITADVMNKTLRAQYDASPRTFTRWARRGVLPDFKEVKRIQLGDAPSLALIRESGEYTYGAIGEAQEKYRLFTYGKALAMNRQLLINDDMDALVRVPGLFGRSAADLESDVVYNILLANAALADGFALFSAQHNNLGTAAAITVASVSEARKLMRKQVNLQGRPISLTPKFLIVGPDKETEAQQFVSTEYVPNVQGNINPFTSLEVVTEVRLPGNTWYLACDSAQIDTVEYAYLEGQEGVYTDSTVDFDTDGMKLKCRHDIGAKAIDFRGLVRNPGA